MQSRTIAKSVRNAVVANRRAQAAIRGAARRGWLPARVYRKIPPLGPHPITSPAGNPFTYVGHLDDLLARGIVWENGAIWEATSLRVFSELVRTAVRVLDVGAYSGIYSLVACVDGPAEVIAFEPNPATRVFLEANVAANGLADRITVVGRGVADACGTARMTIPKDATAARVDVDGEGPAIELTTLDDTLQGRPVDVIKVDVEGLEPKVLVGGRQALEAHRPALILECLSDEVFGELRRVLEPLGYTSCLHLGPGAPCETRQRINMPRFANYLWTHPGAT